MVSVIMLSHFLSQSNYYSLEIYNRLNKKYMHKQIWITGWTGMLSMPGRMVYFTIHVTMRTENSDLKIQFTSLLIHVFLKICEVFSCLFFPILWECLYTSLHLLQQPFFFLPVFCVPLFLSIYSGTPVRGMLVCLMMSNRSLRFCSPFFILFSFCL